MTRLYVPDDLRADAKIELSEAQAHQLRSVLRLQSGALVALFNGRDGEWIGEASIEKRHAQVRLLAYTKPQTTPFALTLAFAPIKQDRMAFLVEKATELGVTQLLPVMTERTQNGRINLDRLGHTAREAAEQCERLDIPLIEPPQSLDAFLEAWKGEHPLLLCAEAGEAKPALAVFTELTAAPVFLVGPEGGFSPQEFALLRAQEYVVPISLGPQILRAETAALAALAGWQTFRDKGRDCSL